jgi:hypothetical protein
VITFMETAVGTPAAIRHWYYPGDRIGHEFIYPKDQAMRIARASNQTVLATEATSTDVEAMKAGRVITVSPTGEVADADTREADEIAARRAPAREPAQPAPLAAPDPAPGPATDPADRQLDDRDRLPQTASALPLVVLIGVGSIGLAAGVRRLRRGRS